MEHIKLALYASGLTLVFMGLTIVFMLVYALCAVFAPVIVLYFVLNEWQSIRDDDSDDDEMFNA